MQSFEHLNVLGFCHFFRHEQLFLFVLIIKCFAALQTGKWRSPFRQTYVSYFFSSKTVRFDRIFDRVFRERPLKSWPPLQGHRQYRLGLLGKAVQGLFVLRFAEHVVDVSHDEGSGVVGRNFAPGLVVEKHLKPRSH